MTLEESKLTLVKDVSKYLNSLFVLLSVVSAYVLYRGTKAMLAGALKSADEIAVGQMQPQVQTYGLVFEYGAMSLFWPIILLVLSYSCLVLLRKYKAVSDGVEVGSSLGVLDPLYNWQTINANRLGRTLSSSMAWLPFLATLVHLIAGLRLLLHIADPEQQTLEVVFLYLGTLLLLQIILALISLIALFGISRQMVGAMRSLK